MRDQLEQRLSQLNVQYETGQRMLAELVEKENQLRNNLLRISGAMQVLEELLRGEGAGGPPGP